MINVLDIIGPTLVRDIWTQVEDQVFHNGDRLLDDDMAEFVQHEPYTMNTARMLQDVGR